MPRNYWEEKKSPGVDGVLIELFQTKDRICENLNKYMSTNMERKQWPKIGNVQCKAQFLRKKMPGSAVTLEPLL